MKTVLYPAIALMNRLSFGMKFSLISVLFFLPMFVTNFYLVRDSYRQFVSTQAALESIDLLGESLALQRSLQDFADLVYRELITQCQHQYPGQLHYQPIVTREAHSGALSKRLPELIQSGELQSACQQSLTNRSQVMLCGNPQMITDTKAVLEGLGLTKNLRRSPGNITVEQYW